MSEKGRFGEPWAARRDAENHVGIYSGSYEVAGILAEGKDGDELTGDEILRGDRISACVNALDGLEPKALPAMIEAANALRESVQLSYGTQVKQWGKPPIVERYDAALAAFGVKP